MESREGEGHARAAWEAVFGAPPGGREVRRIPGVSTWARNATAELLGFWMLWHIHGGFDGLERFGMHRATIFRKVARFRSVFGEHPDSFELPGITFDLEAYWAGAAAAEQLRRERLQQGGSSSAH